MTENIYQGLRQFIPEKEGEDVRSIHFLSFPEVKSEYFDTAIERQVSYMQAIIDLTRNIREKHQIPLKVRLRPFSLLVSSPRPI